MSKQVLTIEQMRHLQELGMELKSTMLSYVRSKLLEDEEWGLTTLEDLPSKMFEQIQAYTLQDILDVLPKVIEGDTKDWLLKTGVYLDELHWFAAYTNFQGINILRLELHDELIDAAYELLCWAIENGFMEIKKKK